MRRKSKIVSKVVVPKVLTIQGLFAPGNVDDKQSSNLSPAPINATQEGGTSKKLMKEASKLRIFRGSSTPRGELAWQTR